MLWLYNLMYVLVNRFQCKHTHLTYKVPELPLLQGYYNTTHVRNVTIIYQVKFCIFYMKQPTYYITTAHGRMS